MKNMIVATTDLKQDYDVIGIVSVVLTDRRDMAEDITALKKKYANELEAKKRKSTNLAPNTWAYLYDSETTDAQQEFRDMVFLAQEELKERARKMGATAIVGVNQYLKVSSNIQVSLTGTAVRLKEEAVSLPERYTADGAVFAYDLTEDGSAYVATIMNCKEGSYLYVPGFHKGLQVRTVKCNQTFMTSKVKGIAFGGGIVEIGEYSFSNAINLEEVIFPENLQIVGAYTFAKCPELKEILVPYGVREVRSMAFTDCPNATIYTLESQIPSSWAKRAITDDIKIKVNLTEVEFEKLLNE